MKKLMSMLLLIAMMTMAACMTSPPEADSVTDQAISSAPAVSPSPAGLWTLQTAPITIRRGESLPATPASQTCEEHLGRCTIGQCEVPRSEIQNVSIVCCENGSCTVQNFRICGCS